MDLLNRHIFKFNKNPETIKETITFITIMVHEAVIDRQKSFTAPTLEIMIYSHHDHMEMDYLISKDNRNDYLSMLIADKFNGSAEYGGIGKLMLIRNTEGNHGKDFLCRKLVFETFDMNKSFCPNKW